MDPAIFARAPAYRPTARPLPEDIMYRGHRYSIAQRVQCVTLMSLGLPAAEASKLCGIPDHSCRNIWKKACDKGYDPQRDPKILRPLCARQASFRTSQGELM